MQKPIKQQIQETQNLCRVMLDVYGALNQNKILFSGKPAYGTKIVQADLDAEFPDSGVTIQDINDAQYALAIMADAITNAMVPLTILSNL